MSIALHVPKRSQYRSVLHDGVLLLSNHSC